MSRSYLCSGNVAPCRFVKHDTSVAAGGYVTAAGAAEIPIGVSQTGTRQPPIPGLDDGYAGVADPPIAIEVHEPPDICWLEVGAAVTTGDLLKPSTNGVAITASSDAEYYGARALESATAAGQLVKAICLVGQRAS